MNQSELQGTLKNFKANDQLKRKLKIFLGVGCAGLLLVGSLIIWASIATVQHVVSLGVNADIPGRVQNLKADIPNIPAVAKAGCWEKVQSLMNVQAWLETPVAENFKSLKDACIEPEI